MTILQAVTRFLAPFILLYGLYVLFHGAYGPGGGFQGGAICASAFVAHALAFHIEETEAILPLRLVRAGAAAGVLLYGATGVLSMIGGGSFLAYGSLLPDAALGQKAGIFLIEAGVGVTVFSVMMTVVYMLGGIRK
jgi:multicomponent Na+:H+ antiporter subunit B